MINYSTTLLSPNVGESSKSGTVPVFVKTVEIHSPHLTSQFLKHLSLLLLLLVTGVGSVWGDTTLFSTDFSNDIWSGKTFSQGNTSTADVHNGVTFFCKASDKSYSIANNALVFPGQNLSTSNYYIAIPIENINGSVTITVKGEAKSTFRYTVDASTATAPSVANQTTTKQDDNSGISTVTVETANTSAKVFIGEQSSSYTKIYSITITTPSASTTHTVTFNAGTNGACTTESLTETSAGAGVTLPKATVNDGYKFVGWSTSSNPSSADAGLAGANYKPSANTTLYAYYTTLSPATVSVTGGGTYEQNASVTLTGSATATNGGAIQYVSGFNSSRAYRWCTCNSDGSNTQWISGQNNQTYSPSTATPGTYYYKFMCVENVDGQSGYKTTYSDVVTVTVNPYTVTFNAGDNGNCTTASLAGATITLPGVTPKADNTFLGWSTNSSASAADAGLYSGATYTPSSNVTLYAIYRSENATIGDANSGWWQNFSKFDELATDKNRNYTFTVAGGDASWKNWVLIATNNNTGHNGDGLQNSGENELFCLRADGHMWGTTSKSQIYKLNGSTYEAVTAVDNSDFITAMSSGTVKLSVSRVGKRVYVYATIECSNGAKYVQTFTSGEITSNVYLSFTSQNSSITFTEQGYADAYFVKLSGVTNGTADVLSAEGISIDQTAVKSGTQVSFTATPNEGYAFNNWTGTVTSTDNPYNTTVTSALELTPNFEATGELAPQRSDYESWLIGGSQTGSNSDFKGDKITLPGTYNPGASATTFKFTGESSVTKYVKIRTSQALITNTSEKGFVIKVNNGNIIDDICVYGTSNYDEAVNITGYRVDGGAVQTLSDEQLAAIGSTAHAIKISGVSAKNTIEFICSGAGQIIAAVGVNYTDGTALTGLSLSPSSTDTYVGEKQQLTVGYTPNEPTNKLVTWSSDNLSVATVSSSGLVTMMGAGTATITATSVADGAITATANFTVQNKKDLTVTTKYDNIVMQAGQTSASYTPEFTVKDGETTLTKTTDYTVEYSMVDDSGSNPITENAGVFSPNSTTANSQHTVTVTATIKPTSPAYNQATAQFKFIVYPTSAGYDGANLEVGTTWEYTPYPYPGNTKYIGVERGSDDKKGYLYVRDADYKNSGLWTKWQGSNDANDCRIRFKVTATTEQPVKVTVTSNSVSGRYIALGKHNGSGNYTTIAHGTAGAATHVFTITETGEYGIAGANVSESNEYNGADLYVQKIVLARVATIVAPQFTVDADGTVRITNLDSYSEKDGLTFYINTNGMTPGADVPYSYFMTGNTYKLPNGTYPAGRLVVTAVKGESDKTTVSSLEYTVSNSTVTVPTVTSIKIGGLTTKRVYVSGTGNTWPNLLTTLNEETHTYETGLRFYGDPSIVVTLSDGTTAPIDRSEEVDGIANTSTAYFVLGSIKYAITYSKATVATSALTEQASAKTWKFKDMFGENGFYIINSVTNNNMTIFASESKPIEYGGSSNGDMEFVGAGTIRERSFAVSVPQGMSTITIAGNTNGDRTINVYTKDGDKKIGSIAITKENSTHEVSYIYKGNATTLYFAVDANDISNLRYFKIAPYKYFNYELVPSEFVMDTSTDNGHWGVASGKNKGGQKSADGFFTLTKDLDLQKSRLHATYKRFDGKTIESANQTVLNFGGAGTDSWNWGETTTNEYPDGRRTIEFTPTADGQLHVYVHSTAYVDNGNDVAIRSLILRDNQDPVRGSKFTAQHGNFMSMLNCAKGDAEGTITEVIYNCKSGRKYSLASCSSGLYVFYMGYHEDAENAYAFGEFETIAAPEVTSKALSGTNRSIVVTQAQEPAGGKHKYNTHINMRDYKSQVDCAQGGFYPSSSQAKEAWIAANTEYIAANVEDGKTAEYANLPSAIKESLEKGFEEAGMAGKQKSWFSIGSPTAENLIYKEDNEHLTFDITKDFHFRCVTINATNNTLAHEKLESGNYVGKQSGAKAAGSMLMSSNTITVASDGTSPIYDSEFVDYMICAAPTISDLKVTYDPTLSKRSDLETTANPTGATYEGYTKQITYLVVPIIQQGVTTNNSTTLSDYVTEGVAVKTDPNVGGVTAFSSQSIKTVAADGTQSSTAASWTTVDDNDASLAGIQNSVDLAAFKGGDKLMIIAVSKLSKDADAVYSFATSRVITIETLKTPVITVNGGNAITTSTETPIYSTIATTYEAVEPADGVVDTKNNVRSFYTVDGSDPVVKYDSNTGKYIAGNSSTVMYDPSNSSTRPALSQTGLIKAMNVNVQTGETSKIVAANVMLAAKDGVIPDVQVIHFQNGKVNKDAKFNDYAKNDAAQTGSQSGQTNPLNSTQGYDRSSKATFLFYENSDGVSSARATISEKLQFSVDNETFAHAETSQNILAFQAYAGSLVKIVAAGNMGNTVSLGYSENGNGAWTQVGNFAVQGDGPVTYYVRIPEDANPGEKKAYYIRRDMANTNIYYVGVYHTEHFNWNQWTYSVNALQGSWGSVDAKANTTGYWRYNTSLPQHSTFQIVSSIDEANGVINLTPYTEPTLESGQGVLVSMVAPENGKAYYVNETLVRNVKDMANADDNDFAESSNPKNYLRGYADNWAGTGVEHVNTYNRQAMTWSYRGRKLDVKTGQNLKDENGNQVYEYGQRFYFYSKGSKFGCNKAYLVLSKSYKLGETSIGSSKYTSAFSVFYGTDPIDFSSNESGVPTEVEAVEEDEVIPTTNVVREGIYTIYGQKVNSITTSGIYIINGKKYFVRK